ncbi:MAG: nucleotide exchange factor GrpE [Symploca sp. SIO2G7]|nr:nucleotide exchange factor GrpE [Symploca sp. SIO2G7]
MSQSPRDRIAQRRQLQKQQSQIFLELLPVLDDLDRACNHWQQAQRQAMLAVKSDSKPWWRKLLKWWRKLLNWHITPANNRAAELNTMVKSAYDGVYLIRQSLLEVLERQDVNPINTVGHPFDPKHMNALGREVRADAYPDTVIKEILKGYCWQERVLREAQVIVADRADADSSNF